MNAQKNRTFDPLSALACANRLMIVLIAAILVYGAVRIFGDGKSKVTAGNGADVSPESPILTAFKMEEPKAFHFYEETVKARDVFLPFGERTRADTAALEKALPALHQRIKLIGILVDNDSKAIIEDLQEKQTHFLSRGETIGTALLEDIREDKVIFLYDNEHVELAP